MTNPKTISATITRTTSMSTAAARTQKPAG